MDKTRPHFVILISHFSQCLCLVAASMASKRVRRPEHFVAITARILEAFNVLLNVLSHMILFSRSIVALGARMITIWPPFSHRVFHGVYCAWGRE